MKYSILIIVVILLVIGYVVLVQEEETIPHSEQVATVTQEEDISGTYVINHRQSRVEWSGARLVGTSHTGTIPIRQTIVVFGENDSGNIIFDMGELTSDTPGLTSHLKSGDFFDVASFPEATFIVRGYDAGMLSGELVIKGIPQYMEIILILIHFLYVDLCYKITFITLRLNKIITFLNI